MPTALVAVFVLTFIESIGTTLLQRGVYFYTHEILQYSQAQNMWLALGSGVVYVAGAYFSHAACERVGERRLLFAVLFVLGATHTLVGSLRGAWVVPLGFITASGLQGLKWPIIESFVSAGVTPDRLLRLLGRYNATWAIAVALAVSASGVLIASSSPSLLFFTPALFNVVAIALALALPARPVHLPDEHPERPDPAQMRAMDRLLVSARWLMLASYALMFVLAPLMPILFKSLELDVSQATRAASLLDGARVASFAGLGAWAGWRAKKAPLAVTIVVLPASFLMVLFGPSLPVVLAGEVLFGLCSGFAYTSSLYYALVVKNASVDAGGAHEALIGLGFALGPSAGLAGSALAASLGRDRGLFLAVAPIIVMCVAGASRSLAARR
jgi:MFS family permease